MILYSHPRKGLFQAFINTQKMDSVAAIVEKTIYGEDDLWFLETDKKEKIILYDCNCDPVGEKMAIPIGIHKSRLIKWTSAIQLKLFES